MLILRRLLQAFHISIWVLIVYSCVDLRHGGAWMALLLFTLFHTVQFLLIGKKIGKDMDYSTGQTLILTLLFGFSWYYPPRQDHKRTT